MMDKCSWVGLGWVGGCMMAAVPGAARGCTSARCLPSACAAPPVLRAPMHPPSSLLLPRPPHCLAHPRDLVLLEEQQQGLQGAQISAHLCGCDRGAGSEVGVRGGVEQAEALRLCAPRLPSHQQRRVCEWAALLPSPHTQHTSSRGPSTWGSRPAMAFSGYRPAQGGRARAQERSGVSVGCHGTAPGGSGWQRHDERAARARPASAPPAVCPRPPPAPGCAGTRSPCPSSWPAIW